MENSKKFIRTAVGYVRHHGRELKNSYGIEAQKNAIRSYAFENGHRILEVFADKNNSGKTYKRGGLKAMLKYIEANPWKVKFLIVSDVTRLSRSTEEFKSIKRFLKDRGVKLISLVNSITKYIVEQAEDHF
jgi:DNA invertase Pin-like site-specific DNA recombinase